MTGLAVKKIFILNIDKWFDYMNLYSQHWQVIWLHECWIPMFKSMQKQYYGLEDNRWI